MKFVHEKSHIEGDVILADGVSVWPFASIRGDEGQIRIGKHTNVQDNVTIHGTVSIGENVTIGHGAIVHGAVVGNNILIGMHATILSGATIGDWAIIAAGSVIVEGAVIPPGSVVMGIPGRVVREVHDNDKQRIVDSYKNYISKIKNKQT